MADSQPGDAGDGEVATSRSLIRDDVLPLETLLRISYTTLVRRVWKEYASEGFGDLRPAHAVIFRVLAPEGASVTQLAARAGMTKQAISPLVAYLVERGYLERAPDLTDRRALRIRRTERGWAVNRTAHRVGEQVRAEWASQLGEEPMRQLLAGLRALVPLVERQL